MDCWPAMVRAIRTKDFLYIHNFKPDRWPAGDPDFKSSQGIFGDVDASPTKTYMLEHKDDPAVKHLFEFAFDRRSAEELCDLKKDPNQMNNVAADESCKEVKSKLAAALNTELIVTKDPLMSGKGDVFDKYPYYQGKIVEPTDEEV